VLSWQFWRNGENSSNFFRKKDICSIWISASLVVLHWHCIILQMLRSQPCDGNNEASKNLIDVSSHKLTEAEPRPNVSTLSRSFTL
jgi:hypothetical protein